MRKITILLAFLFIAGMQMALAQSRSVSGKVTSAEDGMGVPGVSISVKGTTIGTVTDINGDFALDVEPTHRTLVFQYVGMKTQEIEIGQSVTFNIVMDADVLLMEEVVVTALGISREKKSLGFAVQELDGEDVSRVKSTNFVNSLAGKSAGVDILQANTMGGSANVVVRGYTSLTGNNQALFVVDGVPYNNNNTNNDRPVANSTASYQNDGWGGYDYGNNAMDINPDDIESMTVLKGAAATALYGSRAANGVILITTKKGKINTKGGKKQIGVTWNSGFVWSKMDKSTGPQYQTKYGGGYGPFYENEGVPGVEDGYFFYADLDGDGVKDLIAPTSEDASWGHAFDDNINVIQWDALDPLRDNYAEKRPWQAQANGLDYYFRTGFRWNNTVALDGANEYGRFRLAYSNMDEKGMSPNSHNARHNVNFSGAYNFTEKFTVEANMSYTFSNAYGRYGTGYDGLNPMQSMGQWYQANVDTKRLDESWLRADGSQLSWNSSYYDDLHPIYFDNPYWVRNKSYQDDSRDRFFGYISGKYDFNDNLSLSARFSGDIYTTIQNERIAVGSVDPSYYSNFTQSYRELNTELMLRYNKAWEKWSLSVMAGTNFREDYRQSLLGETVGGLVVPDLYSVSNSVSPVRTRESLVKKGVNSLFGQVSVGILNMLYVDLTARNDWTSTFQPDGQDSYFYPAVNVGFLLTELGGMQDMKAMPLLKLRGNYAEVGNDPSAYRTVSTYTQNTSYGDLALFSVNSTQNNPALVEERTKGWEIGLEAKFINNRIGLDVSYYQTSSYDQIMPVSVSPFSGIGRQWVNGGQMDNTGWEIMLLTTPIQTKDWRWDLNVNWWQNRNTVVSLYQEDIKNIIIYSAWDVSVNATVGEPYGNIRGTDFLWTNGKKTVDENGYYLNSGSDTTIGNIQPDWKMGIPTSLSWKGISLNLLIDIQKGGDIYSVSTKYGQATGLYAETAENNDKGNPMRDAVDDGGGYRFPETVYEDGTQNMTYVPAYRWGRAWYYNNSPTARYVFDASYVKLRELAISYSLPSKLLENSVLRQVKFAVTGRNLWVIYKNTDHFDPEASLSSGNNQGIETGSYPIARTFGFNFTLGF